MPSLQSLQGKTQFFPLLYSIVHILMEIDYVFVTIYSKIVHEGDLLVERCTFESHWCQLWKPVLF